MAQIGRWNEPHSSRSRDIAAPQPQHIYYVVVRSIEPKVTASGSTPSNCRTSIFPAKMRRRVLLGNWDEVNSEGLGYRQVILRNRPHFDSVSALRRSWRPYNFLLPVDKPKGRTWASIATRPIGLPASQMHVTTLSRSDLSPLTFPQYRRNIQIFSISATYAPSTRREPRCFGVTYLLPTHLARKTWMSHRARAMYDIIPLEIGMLQSTPCVPARKMPQLPH